MTSALQSVLLFFYAFANRRGYFKKPWVQTLFTTFYFGYKRFFENGFSALIRNHPEIFANGNVVDVGANIGYTAVLFARAVTPPFKVLAFEPERRNFQMLNETLKKRGVQDRVAAHQNAAGARKAVERLWINATNEADHRILTPEFRDRATLTDGVQLVDVVSLDDVLNPAGHSLPVSFIKIDV
jgi:FkbM family methyltransferase